MTKIIISYCLQQQYWDDTQKEISFKEKRALAQC